MSHKSEAQESLQEHLDKIAELQSQIDDINTEISEIQDQTLKASKDELQDMAEEINKRQFTKDGLKKQKYRLEEKTPAYKEAIEEAETRDEVEQLRKDMDRHDELAVEINKRFAAEIAPLLQELIDLNCKTRIHQQRKFVQENVRYTLPRFPRKKTSKDILENAIQDGLLTPTGYWKRRQKESDAA